MSVWCYPPQALAVPRRKEGGHGGLEGHGCPAEVRTGAQKPRPDIPQAPRPSRLTPASWWPGVSGVVGFPGHDLQMQTETLYHQHRPLNRLITLTFPGKK